MEPLCSQSKCGMYKGKTVPCETNAENKTDCEASTLDNIHGDNDKEIIIKQEKDEDEEIENQIIIDNYTGIINNNANKITNSSSISEILSGIISSAKASLASSTEAISAASSLQSDFSLPGCSKSYEGDDSNTTIKNMIRNTRPSKAKVGYKNNFSKALSSTHKSCSVDKLLTNVNISMRSGGSKESLEQLDINVGLGEGTSKRTCSNGCSIVSSSSESFKECDLPSTSSGSKLLGMDETHSKSEFASTENVNITQLALRPIDDDDTDDEYNGQSWCTCLSPQEDADDEDEVDSEDSDLNNSVDSSKSWRKRRYDQPSTSHLPQSAKKFCVESSSSSANNEWSNPTITNTNIVQGAPDVKQWLNRFLSWSKSEKILAIDALINCCGASQVRHMMKTIEPLFQRDFISLLPKELALTVLGYLRPKDLLRAAQTCRYWRFLADDNLLWKEQCRRIGITTLKRAPRYLRSVSPWKAAYMRQHLIEHNWLHKPVNDAIIMRGHDDHVITCLQFYGNRILSGSDDTTLKIWSAVTGKCLRTLVGHSGGVWSSQMVGDVVVSGSTDRTLRVWDAGTGKCLKILAGHTSTVRCLHLHQNRVVSGSRDATLRVWSIEDGHCLRILIGHLAAVRCVQFDGKVVVSGAYDYYVKVWNPVSGECIHTLVGHTNRVYSLQFDGVHVVSGSLDTSIRVWDVESGQLKHTLIGHQSLTSGMELQSNILVSGNADSTVKVWDITTGHCLHTLSGPNKHQSAVTCLQSSNRFVITSSDDGTVKLWDVRTGRFIRNLVELSSGGSGGVVWRIRASATKLICAVGSRNGTEETKLVVLDFDIPGSCKKCDD